MPAERALRLYIDSVDDGDWQRYLPTGMFFGVTTNPKLLDEAGKACEVGALGSLARAAFNLGAQEIHLQVWGRDEEEMFQIGRQLAAIDQRVMVKVPITSPGIRCAHRLISEGAGVTLTALHSAKQALIAAALGSAYAAPYLGRMKDGGRDGLEGISAMQRILTSLHSPTRLLVASIREMADLVALAERGLNTFTLLPKLIDQLQDDKLTQLAAESFEKAAQANNP